MKCQLEKKPVADTSNTIVSSHRLSVIDGSLSAPSDQIDENGAMLKVRKLLSLMRRQPDI
jgi:tRNA A-37 threonylcarbamoyl transferase component Bud32